jgi:predicted RecB family endonuclease
MAGFGGSPGLALFGGLTEGFNKRREEDRATERQNVLNEMTQKQIEQMEFNQQMRQEEVAREAQLRQEQAEAAEARRIEQQGQLDARAEQLAEHLGIELERAQVIAADPQQTARLLTPEQQEQMNELDMARAAAIRSETAATNEDRKLQQAVGEFRSTHPGALQLRRFITEGDERGLSITRRALIQNEGVPPLVVDQYIAEAQERLAETRGSRRDSGPDGTDLDVADASVLGKIQTAGVQPTVQFYQSLLASGGMTEARAKELRQLRRYLDDNNLPDPFAPSDDEPEEGGGGNDYGLSND